MDITFLLSNSLLLASYLLTIKSILYVALGLGLVIFIHELGHFAVAKWCDVYVEGFSVGFGPAIWSKKYGETVYAIRALPLGGFVKMLGQDDANPSEMTDESIADDPRSYTAKTVPQRMAIISAGVIMNVISGTMFFGLAYFWGVTDVPSIVGLVQNGGPAYQEGILSGDEIKTINGKDVTLFNSIMRNTVFSGSKPLEITGLHADGTEFSKTIYPKRGEKRKKIGVGPPASLKLAPASSSAEDKKSSMSVAKNTAVSKATPPFEALDKIVKVDGTAVEKYAQLEMILASKPSEELVFEVERKGSEDTTDTVEITVPPQPFRTLGLWMEIGRVHSIREGSPADVGGLKAGDKIIRVDSTDVGKELNPLRLPDYFSDKAGQEVVVTVKREESGSGDETIDLTITPTDRPAWIEQTPIPNTPMTVPSIGIAYHLIRTVLKVEPDSPAAGKIKEGTRIKEVSFVAKKDAKGDAAKSKKVTFKLSEKENNWAFVFWKMQTLITHDIELVVEEGSEESKTIVLTPQESEDWFLPIRGLSTQVLLVEVQADSFGDAVTMGLDRAYNSGVEVFLTLKSLFSGEVSYKELHGPIGIASIAYQQAERGIPALLLFMGFISINLAVINFLPIPVLDGGHMVFLMWEGITRKKPSEKVVIAATLTGLAFVLGLMLTVVYLDIFEHKIFGG